jgi:hypothetical protein
MAAYTFTPTQVSYTSTLIPQGAETGNAIYGNGLNNTIVGNDYIDFLFGYNGNDILYGRGGNDTLIGGNGGDTLYGEAGNDLLLGEAGNDFLNGGFGTDTLYGGTGNDTYYYSKFNGGIDVINDSKSPTGTPGFGGGTDTLLFGDILGVDIRFVTINNDLYITDIFDLQDNMINTGVKIENFFLGGQNVVEYIIGSDNTGYDLSSFI